MKKVSLYTLIVLSSFFSCKAQKSEVREVSDFSKIKISGALNVLYTSSDTSSVKINARESELERIKTRVENSTLIISMKGDVDGPVTVYVKNKNLNGLDASGATDFKTLNQVKSDSFNLKASGASSVKLIIEANSINCFEVGASHIVLEGTTNLLAANVSGAASLKAYNLIAKTAVIDASGASSVKVNVTEKLNSSASGASDIKIKGDPKEFSAEASSAANISKSKETVKNKEQEPCDTTFYNWRDKRVMVYSCPDDYQHYSSNSNHGFRHWAGFSMASSGYLADGSTTMPAKYLYMELDYAKSFSYQFNLFENQINLVGHRLKLISGFGIDYHSYALANKTTLNPDSSYTYGTIDSTDTYSYKKNKLRNTYLQVPLLLEYNSSNNPKKTFHIAVGAVVQYIVASRTKQVLGYDNAEVTNVRKDSYNFSPWVFKAHLNLGYANWTLFAEYNMTPMFQDGKGPELQPFAIGLRIVPFNII